MKRNKTSSRAMRHQSRTTTGQAKGNSKYAQKVNQKDQMYGPGCCAHNITNSQVEAAKEKARQERKRGE